MDLLLCQFICDSQQLDTLKVNENVLFLHNNDC